MQSLSELKEIKHYGIKRRSGRYPWGSGDNPFQRYNRDFSKQVSEMASQGMSQTDIAAAMGFLRKDKNTGEMVGDTRGLRTAIQITKEQVMRQDQTDVYKLKSKGMSDKAIAEQLGISETLVRKYRSEDYERKKATTMDTVKDLAKYADEKKFLDVGKGIAIDLNISEDRMKNALKFLEAQGYHVYPYRQLQLGTGHHTDRKILCPPDVTYAEMCEAMRTGKVKAIQEYHVDTDGMTKCGMDPPVSVDSKRIAVKYAEDGGTDMDGIVQIRRGVDDLSLGKGLYAQVRIAVDGTHYIKGMAIYMDEATEKSLPKGVDLLVNSNKHVGTPLTTDDPDGKCVLKPMKLNEDGTVNMDNPFGATIKANDKLTVCQRTYTDADGKEQRSCINVVKEPGDVGEWKKTLSSQFLSKQDKELVQRQINQAIIGKKAEYEEIMSVTNPTVRKKLLLSYADSCDADAVDLHAAALPRQSSKFIMTFSDMNEKEVYAPSYNNGEKVALIRYPHAGVWEIPVLTVNNKRDTGAKRALSGDFPNPDAIGIHPKTAAQLSGADSDGDTVLVIPITNSKGDKIVNIKAPGPCQDLIEFDTKSYPMPAGQKNKMQNYSWTDDKGVTHKNNGDRVKQREMGTISNLITDMTQKGADMPELIKADKYSMVVIDAQKHNLDYQRAYKELGIDQLYKKWRPKGEHDSTVISQASTEYRVPEKAQGYKIDPETGKKIYRETGNHIKVKNPETGKYEYTDKLRMTKSTRMAETDDARTLLSKHPNQVEKAYADYANTLKSMANEARKTYAHTKDIEYSPDAYKQYRKEVDSLNEKLLTAKKNAPKERLAQDLAIAWRNQSIANDPTIKDDKDRLSKIQNQHLAAARAQVGANKKAVMIDITDDEWKAIQSGAVRTTKLKEILSNTDEKQVRQLSMPKEQKTLSTAQKSRIEALYNSGKTLSEIASIMGVSTSTVWKVAAS